MSYDYYSTHQTLTAHLHDKDKNQHLAEWRRVFLKNGSSQLTSLAMLPIAGQLALLPRYSTLINIAFDLNTPYISKDETDFYLIDTPVRKEWVFKVPIVAPTSWKGALRATLRQLGHQDTPQIERLFGVIRDNEQGRVGHLYFYPTFFTDVTPGLELINPHDRSTGVGTVPIPIECVPKGSTGTCAVAYIPPVQTETITPEIYGDDIQLVAEGIIAMLTQYGFGAKTSSGYGSVLRGHGQLSIHAPISLANMDSPQEEVEEEPLPRYLSAPGRLSDDLRDDDGSLVSEHAYQANVEAQGKKYKSTDEKLYTKAQKWWKNEREQATKEAHEPPKLDDLPSVTDIPFSSLDELLEKAKNIAAQLRAGGDS